jgi:hypothetical protein
MVPWEVYCSAKRQDGRKGNVLTCLEAGWPHGKGIEVLRGRIISRAVH